MSAPQPQPAKAKQKVNLVSVTPSAPPPPGAEFDTTTPIDVSVIPFTQRELPKWGEWMLYRLAQHWPHLGPMNYAGMLMHHMADNGSLFIRSKKAILLAVVTRETFETRPIVDVVFCFKHHPDEQEEEKDVRLLFRRAESWGRSMGARYVRITKQERLDSTPSRTKDNLWADESKILMKDLDA